MSFAPITGVILQDGDSAGAAIRVRHKGLKVGFTATIAFVFPPPFSGTPRVIPEFTEELDLAKAGEAVEVLGSILSSHTGAVGPFLVAAEGVVASAVKAVTKT